MQYGCTLSTCATLLVQIGRRQSIRSTVPLLGLFGSTCRGRFLLLLALPVLLRGVADTTDAQWVGAPGRRVVPVEAVDVLLALVGLVSPVVTRTGGLGSGMGGSAV